MSKPNVVVINLPDNITPVPGTATVALTVSTVAVTLPTLLAALNPPVVLDALTKRVMLTVETATVREAPEGGTPTGTVGQPWVAGQKFLISRAEALAAKWIRDGAASSDAKLQLTQYTY